MNRDRWQTLESIVSEALDLEPALRPSFLKAACSGHPDLFDEALSLINQDTSPGFLAPLLQHSLPDPWIGSHLGPYRVLSRIGSGGMGTVYRAIREDGQFEQTVAIKVLADSASPLLRQRFESERHILAQLDHPSISRLLDSGLSPAGAPYLVMEFVEGQPLLNALQPLSLNQSLDLFRHICSAVQYAHQRLIIHRDIKPSNILVTSSSQPKLLDFGIAKLQSDTASRTTTILRPMTLNYASPEQIQGDSLTTASDIYSLGLLLFEFAYRHPARNLASRTLNEIIAITTSPVPRHPRRFGDLDAIIDKALQPDPAQRYSSVAALSADIDRYQSHQPVEAKGPSPAYLLAKFLRRHLWAAAATLVTLITLIAAIFVLTQQNQRLAAARDLAEHRRAETERQRLLALDAEQQALKQRHLAEQATATARANFEDLRKLSGAVLYEFNDGIRNLPGTLEVRQKMLSRSTEYLEKLSRYAAANPNDASIWRELGESYSRLALLQGGANNASLGDSDAMLANLARSESAFRKWLALTPSDPTSRLRFAEQQLSVFYELNGTNRLPQAHLRLDTATSLLKPYLKHPPNNEAIRRVLANHAFAQGFVATTPADKLAALSRSRAHYSWINSIKPTDLPALRNLALTHKYESDILRASSRDSAIEHLHLARGYDEQRLRLAPLDASARLDLSYDLTNLGDLAPTHSEAISLYQQAVDLRRQLQQSDPSNQLAIHRLAQALAKIANRAIRISNPLLTRSSATEAEQLFASLPQNMMRGSTPEIRGRAQWALARVALLDNDRPTACALLRKAATMASFNELTTDLLNCP